MVRTAANGALEARITGGGDSVSEKDKPVIEIATFSEDVRSTARELIARHGKAAVTIAEWHAVEHEDNGRPEEAKRWMIIAGTILAITED